MRWTLDNLDDDDPELMDDLPQPVEITRASLAVPDFDVQQFLTEHSRFQTLRDTQANVRDWEERLHAELYDVVNAQFDEFVHSVDSLQSGRPPLDAMRNDVVSFKDSAERIGQQLTRSVQQLQRELSVHRGLSVDEGNARKLLYMYDLIDELETSLPDVDAADTEDLVSLSKSYVAALLVADDYRDVKAVHLLRASLHEIQRELQTKLDNAVKQATDSSARLELLEAREWILQA